MTGAQEKTKSLFRNTKTKNSGEGLGVENDILSHSPDQDRRWQPKIIFIHPSGWINAYRPAKTRPTTLRPPMS